MAGPLQSWTLENLAGGMDLRRERSTTPNTLRIGQDIRFTDGGSIINRPPRWGSNTTFSHASTAGLLGPFLVSNKLTAVNVKGLTATVPAEVTQVLAISGIESTALNRIYLDHETVGDVLCLLLGRETAAANHYRVELHVFDQAGDLGTNVNGFGSPWAAWDLLSTDAWRPKLGFAGGSLTMSGPDGNIYRSAVGNPRVWWDLDQEDQYDEGWEFVYYFSGHASEKLVMPVDSKRLYAWAAATYSATGIQGFNGFDVHVTKPDGSVLLIEDGTPALATVTNGGSAPTYANWVSVAQLVGTTGLYRVRVYPPRPGVKRGRYHTIGNQAFKVNTVTVLETWVGTAVQKVFDITGGKLWFNETNRKHIEIYINGVFLSATGWSVSAIERRDLGDDWAEWATQVTMTTGVAAGDIVELRHIGHFSLRIAIPTFTWTTVLDPCLLMVNGKTEVFKGGTIQSVGTTTPQRALELAKNSDGYWVMDYRDLPGTPTGIPDYYRGNVGRVLIGILDMITWRPFASPADQTWEEGIWQIGALFSGRDDAGMLPTGKRGGGSAVTGLLGFNNRLLITWKDRMALWAVNEDSGTDRFLGEVDYGTGDHASAMGVELDGEAVVPVADGIASISLGSQLADRMKSQLISQAIIAERYNHDDRLRFLTAGVQGMAWWPTVGMVALVEAQNADFNGSFFLVRQEVSGKAAWVIWTGLTSTGFVLGTLLAHGKRLYWRENIPAGPSVLRWLDLEPADGKQHDQGSVPIGGLVRFNQLHWGTAQFKAFESFDLGLAKGQQCAVRFQLGSSGNWRPGPTLTRDTRKGTPAPAAFTDVTVAPELAVTTAANGSGFRIDALGMNFRIVRRGP